jgi:hypothetical protein
MNVTIDCDAPDTFYRAEEGGETMPWRRNNRRRVEFINGTISRRREEGITPHFERGKEHVGRLLFPARRGDQRMQRRGGDRQPESGDVCIDLRWKTTSRASWVERLFGSDIVVEIK